jgi:hypothetical protein
VGLGGGLYNNIYDGDDVDDGVDGMMVITGTLPYGSCYGCWYGINMVL